MRGDLRSWLREEPPTEEVVDARAMLSAADRRAAERAERRGTTAANPTAGRYVVALAQQRLRRDEESSTLRWVRLGLAIAGPFVVAGILLFADPARSTILWAVLITLGLWWETVRRPIRVRRARAAIAANTTLADPPGASNEPIAVRGSTERAVEAALGSLSLAMAITITRGLDDNWGSAIERFPWTWAAAAFGAWIWLRPEESKTFTPRA